MGLKNKGKRLFKNGYWTSNSNILDESNIINIRNSNNNRAERNIDSFDPLFSNSLIELSINSNRITKVASESLLEFTKHSNRDLGDFYGS